MGDGQYFPNVEITEVLLIYEKHRQGKIRRLFAICNKLQHKSAVVAGGRSRLRAAYCTIGKSYRARVWQFLIW